MAFLDEMTEQEVKKNKTIRGYILRSLAKGSNNTLFVKQISNALYAENQIYNPDIGKYLEYLAEAGYIEFTGKNIHAYNVYAKDGIIKLTRKGVDLLEDTIEDPGVNV